MNQTDIWYRVTTIGGQDIIFEFPNVGVPNLPPEEFLSKNGSLVGTPYLVTITEEKSQLAIAPGHTQRVARLSPLWNVESEDGDTKVYFNFRHILTGHVISNEDQIVKKAKQLTAQISEVKESYKENRDKLLNVSPDEAVLEKHSS